MLRRTRIKKIVRVFVVFGITVSMVFAGFPVVQLAKILSEHKIVDNLYLSKALDNVVDNFGVQTAKANPGTRVRTVEFFAGQDNGSATNDSTATVNALAAQTVSLAESSVVVQNAYVEFTAEVGGTASASFLETLLYFDSCTPTPCSPSPAVMLDLTNLGTTSGEGQTVRLRANVTSEGTLAAYTGGGANFSFQVSYCVDGTTGGTNNGACDGTAAANIQAANAKLVVTYTYDDTSATQTNTVIYPLDSGTDVGSKTASQVACTVDSNCPTFSYNAEIPEIGTQISQFFHMQTSIQPTTTTDWQTISDIGGNPGGANTNAVFFEEALSANGGWMNVLLTGTIAGYANNSAQSLEMSTNATASYVMGGEDYVTYSYANSAGTKTKTSIYPVGEVQKTGSTTKTALTGPTVYFPEAGVTVKKAWFRVHASNATATAGTLRITHKVGSNSESGNRDYSFAEATVPVSNDGYFIYIIPSADYAELQSATGTSGKLAQMTAAWVTTAYGAVSAELVVTYTYTSDSAGYNVSQTLFAGQQTVAPAAASLSLGTLDPKIAESSNVTITGASLFMNSKGAAFATADEALNANLHATSCTAAAVQPPTTPATTTIDDIIELDRYGFFKDVTSVVTNNDATTYIPCYDTAENGVYGGRIEVIYKWVPPTLTIGATAGSVVSTKNSGDTGQYAHLTSCTSATDCAAFTLLPSNGNASLTSIKISEVGTAAANTDLANGTLYYDTNGNWADAEAETQYGSTSATFDSSQTATFSASLSLTSGTTYYFYVGYDLASTTPTYPKGGQTVSFSIAANADVVSDGTETGAAQTLAGTQTVLPTATSVTYTVGSDGGRSGASATISGKGFGAPGTDADQEDCSTATVDIGCVRFIVGGNDTVEGADIGTWNNTTIAVTISATGLSATNGGAAALEVVAGAQLAVDKLTYYVYPTISGYTAALSDGDYQDQTITISGDHLGSSGAASNVSFNGTTPASVGTWASTSIATVDIPNGGTDSGTITVTRASDSKASNASSTFYIYPQITSFTNTTDGALTDGGRQTHVITITGNHFGTGGVASDVTINSVASDSLTWTSSSSLTSVAIPDSGSATDSGVITVRNPQTTKTSNNSSTFYIYPDIVGLTTVCDKITTPAWPADSAREYSSGDSDCPNGLKDGHVQINGTHFGAAGSVALLGSSATQVTVGTNCSSSAYTTTCIMVQVPTGIANNLYTGDIIVMRTAGSKTDNYSGFRILPRIASTGPVNLKGARGDTGVSITGDHLCQSGTCPTSFSTTNKVSFTGASVTSGSSTWTDTSVPSITIPSAAADGSMSVLSNTSYVSNNLTYDVKFKPDVSGSTGRLPADAATGQTENPSLTGITFADGTGDSDSHIITNWEVARSTDSDTPNTAYSHAEWTQTSATPVTSTTVNSGGTFLNDDAGQTKIDCSQTYKWHYRYKDSGGVSSAEWSSYSPDFTFTTIDCSADAISLTNVTEGGLTDGGRIGQTITLTGNYFGTVSAGSRANCAGGAGTGCIKITGTSGDIVADGNVTAWTSTSITFSLPSSVTTYGGTTTSGVIVYGAGVSDSNGLTFYVYPDITSLDVSEAREADTITITGNHFGTGAGTNTVTIDGVTATGCSWSETSLSGCTVPTGIPDADDSVSVVAYQGTGGNNALFDTSTGFTILPRITSVSAATYADGGYQDGTFTVNGSHFGSSQGTGNVSVNTVNQDGTITWGVSTLTGVGIPDTGADSGNIVVTRDGDSKTSNSYGTFYIYPQITSYTATNADGDTQLGTITITGNHFGTGGAASDVTINTVISESLTWTSATSLTSVAIPDSGADSGTITVRNPQTTKTSNTSSTFVIYPDVTSLTVPTAFADAGREYDSGDSDGVITVNGTHFGAAGTLTVAGSSATQQTTGTCTGTAYQATCTGIQIPAVISDTTYTGNIVLTRTSDSKIDTYAGFRVLPRITSNSPTSAIGGDRIKIAGDHLCQTGSCPVSPNRSASGDNVLFGSTQAADGDFVNSGGTPCSGNAQAWVDTEACVNVPAATPAGSQPTLVTSNSYTSNAKAFTRSSTVPNDPDVGPGTSKGQYRSNGTTVISTGGTTNQTSVVFKMEMSVPAGTPTLVPQVEVKAIATAFDGSTNITEGTGVAYAGSPVTGSVTVSSLTNETNYHWRARVKNNSTAELSGWVNFGSNTENPPTNPAAADFYIDTAAPNISAVSAGTPSDITATITWTTAISADSSVEYGTAACGTSITTTSDASLVTSHSITLNALVPSTTYNYAVKSTDAASNLASDPSNYTTSCRQFTTAAPVTRLTKTVDYFIVQDTTTSVPDWSGASGKPYNVYVSEYDALNAKAITLKNAYVEVSGVAVSSGAFTIRVGVNSQDTVTYNLPSTGGNPQYFNIIYDVTSLNYDFPGDSSASNTLYIDFPSAPTSPTSVSTLSAHQYFTYHYTP